MIPYTKAKHAEFKRIEGGGTSLVLTALVIMTPPETEYEVGEPILYEGMTLFAQYEDSYYRDVTDIATYSIPKGTIMTDEYEGEVIFTYEENGVRVQTSIEITVVSGVTWANTSAPKLIEAFEAAYAGDTEILSSLAVGDIRSVTLQDGNTAHLILAKANPVNYYAHDGDAAAAGTAKFIVTMQEAYPIDSAPSDFFALLPSDLQPLFKYHKYTEYYDCSGTSHYSRQKYSRAFSPNYTFFTSQADRTYATRISSTTIYYLPTATDTIDLRISANGYYDSNTVDTSGDVFSQSNRVYRNILNPTQYIQKVAGRGYSTYSTNQDYWYMNNPSYDCINNYGKSINDDAGVSLDGYTYCMLV